MKKAMILMAVIGFGIVFMMTGCKSAEHKGAIPYIGKGFDKGYCLSEQDLQQHNGEIVLWMVKF